MLYTLQSSQDARNRHPRNIQDMLPIKVDDWDENPYPPLSDDSAVRQWRVRRSSRQNGMSGDFTIIVPTGDSVVGKPNDDLLAGGLLWKSKADTIKTLLRDDWQPVRLMHLGQAYSCLSVCERLLAQLFIWPQSASEEAKETLKGSQDARPFSDFEGIFQKATSVAALRQDVRDIILMRSWDKYRQERTIAEAWKAVPTLVV